MIKNRISGKSALLFFFIIHITGVVLICSSCASLFMGPTTVNLNKNYDQSKIKRVAVIPFDTKGYRGFDQNCDIAMADLYSVELLKTGYYEVVERSRLEKIVNELGIQMSGLVDEKTASKAGKLLGVNGLVFGSSAGQPGQFTSIVKLVDVETGAIAWTIVLETSLPKIAGAKLKIALDEYYENKAQSK